MAWDFETDAEYQELLDWADEFVREEVEPLDLVWPDEQFVPVPVDGFLADSDVKLQQPDGTWAVVPGSLPTSGGPWRSPRLQT